MRISEEIFLKHEMPLDTCVNTLSQAILNILKDEHTVHNLMKDDKVLLNKYSEQLEEILKETVAKYSLTYGEIVKILASQISSQAKYSIRWERHGDMEKEGDLE